MIKRRDFLINSGLALGALAIAPSIAFNAKKKNIGLQLYSLRASFPKDVKGVLEQVAKAGFTEVETYGYSVKNGFFDTPVKEFKTILSANGLKNPSGHYDLGSLLKDGNTEVLKNTIEAANLLGNKYITIPWLDDSIRKTADDYKKIAENMNLAAVVCKESGLKLAYHNHAFEFTTFGQTNGYEILLNETDKKLVDFELDLYWVERSGNNPLHLFKEHPGRFSMWHVKDMDKNNQDWNTEIGKGAIDFKAIFAEAKLSGMKHFFVEQETNYIPNPIESVKTSCTYINKNLV
ncbi:sugar phosphate isomerase/epimerase [Flavobacterium galactosidilyticum]|uniref:sugar phosphate isomerase/epimerase family protein n=1 Tax=Flavobacterium galactosidilyticum TaxID=2893886 RepID=UPI001E5FE471|nr:sugar phosphate isomerase/epimerase family protein [Flavobacterium sp. F-340]UFH45791.1 sugar phosphate isomerase/epimerase [Flavobacterium sp. F-340]